LYGIGLSFLPFIKELQHFFEGIYGSFTGIIPAKEPGWPASRDLAFQEGKPGTGKFRKLENPVRQVFPEQPGSFCRSTRTQYYDFVRTKYDFL
jgi:hypothetical protein